MCLFLAFLAFLRPSLFVDCFAFFRNFENFLNWFHDSRRRWRWQWRRGRFWGWSNRRRRWRRSWIFKVRISYTSRRLWSTFRTRGRRFNGGWINDVGWFEIPFMIHFHIVFFCHFALQRWAKLWEYEEKMSKAKMGKNRLEQSPRIMLRGSASGDTRWVYVIFCTSQIALISTMSESRCHCCKQDSIRRKSSMRNLWILLNIDVYLLGTTFVGLALTPDSAELTSKLVFVKCLAFVSLLACCLGT